MLDHFLSQKSVKYCISEVHGKKNACVYLSAELKFSTHLEFSSFGIITETSSTLKQGSLNSFRDQGIRRQQTHTYSQSNYEKETFCHA